MSPVPWEEPDPPCSCVWDEDDPAQDLHDPGCARHGESHPPGPSSSPTAVTVWCGECQGPSDVAEAGSQTDPYGVEWFVRLLSCGHEEGWQVGMWVHGQWVAIT